MSHRGEHDVRCRRGEDESPDSQDPKVTKESNAVQTTTHTLEFPPPRNVCLLI